jgi:hypothetical protein
MKDTKPMGAEHPDSVSLGFGLGGPCLTVRAFVAVHTGTRFVPAGSDIESPSAG